MSFNPADPAAGRVGRAQHDTKNRLLDAAERLFAEHGFEGTSVRAVTRAAAASVSAANYHFGSKEALLHAALVRRLEPLNRRRLECLTAAEQAAGGGPVSVEAIVEAFLRPGFEARRSLRADQASYRHIAARLYTDPHGMFSSLKAELFGPVIGRFLDALGRALPDRSLEELALGFQFLIGVMVHVISSQGGGRQPHPEPTAIPDDLLLDHMISFTAAGLRAASHAGDAGRRSGGRQ
jgi:AcrR family transcriptional regulator